MEGYMRGKTAHLVMFFLLPLWLFASIFCFSQDGDQPGRMGPGEGVGPGGRIGPEGGMGPGGMMGYNSPEYYENMNFTSNGQRIYFTSRSDSGEPITYIWEFPMGRTELACVSCHGPEGRGGELYMMMTSFDVPDITWYALTEKDDPPYTVNTLKRAITEGLDQEGKPLEEFMPRWSMAPQDLTDLVDFIRTLR
jgi:cytochrome c oxidase subunit 2